MEHIVQFGITIDDDAIKNLIVNKASETVVKEVKRELGVDNRYFSNGVVTKMVSDEVQNQFNLHKEEIIEATAKALAEKLIKTKLVKERVSKVLDNVLGKEGDI